MRSSILVLLMVLTLNGFSQAQEFEAQETLNSSLKGVVGIELLFSAPSSQSIASRWGHSFILLRNPSIPIEKNLVIELVANVSDADLSYLKAITSGYVFKVQISTFEDKVSHDTYFHGRNLSRLIVSLSEMELNSVLDAVSEANKNPQLLSNYNFFFNNCATGLSQLFVKAKLMSGKIFLPNNFQSAFQDSGISPFPKLVVLGRPGLLAKIKIAFGHSKEIKTFPFDFYDSDFALIKDKYGIAFLASFYYEPEVLSDASRARLGQYLLPHFDSLNWEHVLGLRAPPSELYKAPVSAEEADKINTAREVFFGTEGLISDLNYFVFQKQTNVEHSASVNVHISRILRDPSFKMIPMSSHSMPVGYKNQPRFQISNEKIYAEFWPDLNKNPEVNLESLYIQIKDARVYSDGTFSIGNLSCVPEEGSRNQFENCKILFSENMISVVGFNKNMAK